MKYAIYDADNNKVEGTEAIMEIAAKYAYLSKRFPEGHKSSNLKALWDACALTEGVRCLPVPEAEPQP